MKPARSALTTLSAVAVCVVALAVGSALAHFQMIVPSKVVVERPEAITLGLLFNHPMEGHVMNMAKPKAFGVVVRGGERVDLLDTLQERKVGENSTWTTSYRVQRPGDHIFYVEPEPYWEPAEDCYIIHYAKVVVGAMGLEQGWDVEVGLKTEIVPLVRPYGLWAGNVFRGIVKLDGKAVPFATIEVEYYNEPGKTPVKARTPAHVTQVIKANAQGEFTYAMPRAGWWGFAALSEADFTIERDGAAKPVELGAVMWVHTDEME